VILEYEAAFRLGGFDYEAAFEVDRQVMVLFGHSGAGKSLTLQAVAGLVRPAAGRIAIDGQVVFDAAAGIDLLPQQRRAGYVVQELALFPHMTVQENVAFGLTGRRADRHRGAAAILERFGLQGFEDRRPDTLSGGQRQRVALARALARDVPLLLLDEPFSALDEVLRRTMRAEVARLRDDLGIGVVFVTHDLREAHLLADRIAVFDQGRLLQVAPREEVFRRPTSRRVAELTGVPNVWRGTVTALAPGVVEVDAGGLVLRAAASGPRPFVVGQPVDLAVRADRVLLRREGAEGGLNVLPAERTESLHYGPGHTLRFRPLVPGPVVEVDLPDRAYERLEVGRQPRWLLELPPSDLHVMPVIDEPGD